MTERSIVIKGARQHNLKNINLEIPRDLMVVITGLSGSGKSHLLLTPFLQKVNVDILNLYRLMLDNF